jgi:hypothetical protein
MKKAGSEPSFQSIPVARWTGKKFFILEKAIPFQEYGFELYTAPYVLKASATLKSDLVLPNRRLRYLPFFGTCITATSVCTQGKGEYIVSFLTDTLKMTVYGTTKHGTIEGIAPADDLEKARKRWLGTTVYSRRRTIDQYDSLTATFTSKKVSLLESLTVADVRWGILPLPPKPVWLIVRCQDSSEGIIPVYSSWTNVQESFKTGERPWDADIFEKNPKELYPWDSYVWETIDKHSISLGMTTDQVRISWGEPQKIQRIPVPDKKKVTLYFYDAKKLSFENDSLVKEE